MPPIDLKAIHWGDTVSRASSPLWTFSYASRAIWSFDAASLDYILAGARARNRTLGVASRLVHWDNWFFQVLEGPRDQLLAIFDCFIAGADIHNRLILAGQGALDRRTIDRDLAIDIRVLEETAEANRMAACVADLLSDDLSARSESAGTRLCEALRRTPVLEPLG